MKISRRDFLKITGAAAASLLTPEQLISLKADNNKPNIIILLCDALSAAHLSMNKYPRQTSPNIDAFAERSMVFHNHFSGGNYTTPGTASMLTGMLPWKHRGNSVVRSEFTHINPYTLLGPEYFRFAFCQNPWADRLVGQYQQDVDRFLAPSSFSLLKENSSTRTANIFKNDRTIAEVALNSFMLLSQGESVPAGSSVFGYLHKSNSLNFVDLQKFEFYPHGVPEVSNGGYDIIPYLNEHVYSGIYSELLNIKSKNSPYFAYFHLYSPHFPYKPHLRYQKLFRKDGFVPVEKRHPSFSPNLPESYVSSQRALYDRQIAQVDREFGKLIKQLDENGILNNSYLIFTADHGELFERGFIGHSSQFMYDPVLHVPLIIHAPGQTKRQNIFTLTSNTDILPTILNIAGKDIPSEIEGKILPGFDGAQEDMDRPIFSIYSVENSSFTPITKAAIVMRKHNHKLIAYLGYDNVDRDFELYDIASDPDELYDLASKDTKTLSTMKTEFFAYLDKANSRFKKP